MIVDFKKFGIWTGMLLDEDDAIGFRLSEDGPWNLDCSGWR
jgi:hypothetical protein